MALRAVFPGSFDPLTVAHVAMATAARAHIHDVSVDDLTVDLAMSAEPLGKDIGAQQPLADRRSDIEVGTADLTWLDVVVVDARLVVDLAAGYDRVILGADKWAQLFDPQFYDSRAAQADVLHRLCPALVFGRPGHLVERLRSQDTLLDLAPHVRDVSSSGVREGRNDWRYRRSESAEVAERPDS